MDVTVRAETDTGRVRDHNEGYFAALGGEESPPGVDALLVVADGMGGHAAGGRTAKGVTIIVEKMVGVSGLEPPASSY